MTNNPLINILSAVKSWSVSEDYGLERTYTISKSNKILGLLREEPGINDDLVTIDHNKVLELYPQHEYLFGPYNDSNAQEFNLVYILYSNRHNQDNELKLIYAGRVLMHHLGIPCGTNDTRVLDSQWYNQTVIQLEPVPNRKSLHCYYRPYSFNDQERAKIKEMYGCNTVCDPKYNALRENYSCFFGATGKNFTVNPFRVLYEIYHAKARLPEHVVTSPANGRKADVRPDNVIMRDLIAEDLAKRKEALEVYGLDTYRLEEILASTGFNRFRGIYIHDGPNVDPCFMGRRYVKLVKNGTDIQIGPLLSNALMTVKLGRILLKDETVDHIDHDHSNDDLSNLRIIGKAAHVSEDSVRVDISPTQCGVCGTTVKLTAKQYGYYSNNDAIVTCSDKCKADLRKLPLDKKVTLLHSKDLDHRYYIVDKQTGEWLYFDSKNYDECRQFLFKNGKPLSKNKKEISKP